jgi:hypothetical protein
MARLNLAVAQAAAAKKGAKEGTAAGGRPVVPFPVAHPLDAGAVAGEGLLGDGGGHEVKFE